MKRADCIALRGTNEESSDLTIYLHRTDFSISIEREVGANKTRRCITNCPAAVREMFDFADHARFFNEVPQTKTPVQGKIGSPLLSAENTVVYEMRIDPITVMPVQLSAEMRAEFGVPDPGISDSGQEAAREADMANEAHVSVPTMKGNDD